MDARTTALAVTIGERVRHARRRRRWTLDQLSAAAGVSRRALLNLEQGTSNPSVGTLLRLAAALGVGLPALVEPPPADPVAISVTRRGDGAVLWRGEHGGEGVLLAGVAAPDAVELWEWVLAPGDERTSEPHGRGTCELVHVAQGRVGVAVGDVAVTLEAGDAASFTADTVHRYTNAGPGPARFTMAVFEPGAQADGNGRDAR